MATNETTLPSSSHSDTVSAFAFHPSKPLSLLSSSWDASIVFHDLSVPIQRKINFPAAVLDVAWGEGSTAYCGGLDRDVLRFDVETGETTAIVTTHEDAVKCVEYSSTLGAVISASWDKTLRLTSTSTPGQSVTLQLPEKPYAMALSSSRLVVAMAARAVWIYTLSSLGTALSSGTPAEPEQKRESSLKFMTRALACMPDGTGYCTSSIEGRVAVEFFDTAEEEQKKKFAFKCHRATIDGVDTVYPVTGLAFNPAHGTFASSGADSTVSLWDPWAKKRLRQLPKYQGPITALSYNCDGSRLAVAWGEDGEGRVTIRTPEAGEGKAKDR